MSSGERRTRTAASSFSPPAPNQKSAGTEGPPLHVLWVSLSRTKAVFEFVAVGELVRVFMGIPGSG